MYLISGQTIQETVAIVQSTSNRSIEKDLYSVMAEKFPDTSDIK